VSGLAGLGGGTPRPSSAAPPDSWGASRQCVTLEVVVTTPA
jgi:hypothetical protein